MSTKKRTRIPAIILALAIAVTMTFTMGWAEPAFGEVITDTSKADDVLQMLNQDLDDLDEGNITASKMMIHIQGAIQNEGLLAMMENECKNVEKTEKAYLDAARDFESALADLINQMKLAEESGSAGALSLQSADGVMLASSAETFSLEEYETYYAKLKAALDSYGNGVSGYKLNGVVEDGYSMAGDMRADLEDTYDDFNEAMKGFKAAVEELKIAVRIDKVMESWNEDKPDIEFDKTMYAKQKVTYSCVWFGSYPQIEIVDEPAICGVYRYWKNDETYKVNKRIYNLLEKATGWDEHGDITIEGVKYRRIKQSDTLEPDSNDSYNWNSTYGASPNKYHYFRYMPIKWRILDHQVNYPHDKIMLVADKLLDCQPYNVEDKSVTWERSTLRSWLNGLGSGSNDCGIDYTNENFIDTAFTEEEQNRIYTTDVNNSSSGSNTWSYGGNDTQDEVFLLSQNDIDGWETHNPSYGFTQQTYSYDEATYRKGATYARAMGAFCSRLSDEDYRETGNWWLRSPGKYPNYACHLNAAGSFRSDGDSVSWAQGICPVIVVAGSEEPYLTHAGTVCTNGTVKEENAEIVQETQDMKVTAKTVKVKYAKVKKKAQNVAPMTATGTVGSVTYKVTGGTAAAKKALTVNAKTGKVTVKKKTKKGTYKIKVTVTASGNQYYEKASVSKNVTVKVVK